MEFGTVTFLFIFFPLVFLGCYIVKDELQNYWLLAASMLFYAWGEPKYIFLVIGLSFLSYYFGLVIDIQGKEIRRRKVALIIAILINLGILVFFKYTAFFAEIIFKTTGFDIRNAVFVNNGKLPIGISFFTFKIVSYLIDVYRGKIDVQKKYTNLALYIFLFPQMLAGPIARYSDMASELESRKITADLVYNGLNRFMIGFSKKILISSTMAIAADYAFEHIGTSSALSWMGAVCYTLQIYYDFSGYSDMAIGMSMMAGFHIKENFLHPYLANCMRDFWHRWHISLSTWFRDYIYIPLGGNRKGTARTYLNQLIVFFTTGLWHGANFTFIIWGLYHGCFLCLEKFIGQEKICKVPKIIMHVYTLLVVIVGWVFFRANSLMDAVNVVITMFDFSKWNLYAILPIVNKEFIFFFFIAIVSVGGMPKRFQMTENRNTILVNTISIAVFSIAVLYMIGTDFNPFIYLRF